MRSDKDEIARLKMEVIALQKKNQQEKPVPVPVPVAASAKAPAIDVDKLKADLAAAQLTIKKQAREISESNKRSEEALAGFQSEIIKEKSRFSDLQASLNLKCDESKKNQAEIASLSIERDIAMRDLSDCIQEIKSLKADLAESKKEINRITTEKDAQISEALKSCAQISAERDSIAEKIECINMLKIKNSELEYQVFSLSERVQRAEAMNR